MDGWCFPVPRADSPRCCVSRPLASLDHSEPRVYMVSLNDSCLDICDPVQTGSEPLVPLVRTRFEPESGSDRVRTGRNQRFQPVRTRCRFEPGSNRLEPVVRTGSNRVYVVSLNDFCLDTCVHSCGQSERGLLAHPRLAARSISAGCKAR